MDVDGKLVLLFGGHGAIFYDDAAPSDACVEVSSDLAKLRDDFASHVVPLRYTISAADAYVWLTRLGRASTVSVLGRPFETELFRSAFTALTDGARTDDIIVDRGPKGFHGLRFRCGDRLLLLMPMNDIAYGTPMPLVRYIVPPESPEYRATLYARARAAYGDEKQIEMVGEECSETLVELFHRKRGREHHLVDEIADLTIMAEQARIILGADAVDAAIARKLARLDERVTKHEQGLVKA